MTLESLQAYCAQKSGVSWDTPFGPDVLVFRVAGKIFVLAPIEVFDTVNLKCDPERAIELRERYDGIIPGYHMNKQHWNTVDVTGSVPEKLILELVDHSYDLIRASLPRKLRDELT
ncbi:MAG: MmcQ/YjbR family DNA-binding protein [Flavobacteriales bacterium]|mgnify:FL=1|nr:MmcQ/YjbR family DNA-binding protein [Flavobacteriales bacterium]MCC6939228.1 MmcQ/YjbR family DNA-binding protein [Flavobacteriales bacterium]